MKILPKKSLGQNFLTDINIINKIIDIGDINNKEDILEVGPGTGNLTREIVKRKPNPQRWDNKQIVYLLWRRRGQREVEEH